MGKMKNFTILLLISCLLNGCIQQAPEKACDTTIIGSGELTDAPPLVYTVEDPLQDFMLDHPFFEERFDVVYQGVDVIPPAVDIVRVELQREGDYYYFQIFTAGNTIPEQLERGMQVIQFGIFVDIDLNGVTDLLLTSATGLERGVVVASDFGLIEEMPSLAYDSTSMTISASAALLGDSFEWIAFTAYSPQKAYYKTPLKDVVFVPEVDLAYADTERRVLFSTSVSGTGRDCQITETRIYSCPPRGNPPGRQRVPGSTCKGWMLKQKQCGDIKIELWCNCSSGRPSSWHGGAFGKRVEQGFFKRGWVAKCPFFGGQNSQVDEDTDNDGIPDKVHHAVADRGLDDDGDGYLDIMIYKYDFKTNLVTIINVERDYRTGAVVNVKYLPWGPVPPFISPNMVPGQVN
jgi:hypothetical protein